jgi:hypothetical protein
MRLRLRDDDGFRWPSRRQFAVFLGYVAAGGLYVLIGVTVTDFLLSVVTALVYVLVVAWVVPTAVRRFL